MKKLIIINFTIAIIVLNTCNDNPVAPEDKPGRRDYTWIVDTLDIFYPSYKIWGSSPNDVWAINESDNYHNIWHFDGNRWSTDGVFRFILPHAIWGFSSDNIYIGGIGGLIWHYDGIEWKQTAELKKDGIKYIAFENIWGASINDIYAVGSGPGEMGYYNKSVIVHFENNQWNFLNTNNLIGNVVNLYQNKSNKRIYIQLIRIGGIEHVDSTIIYEKTNNGYNKIYSSVESKGFQSGISLISGEVYFILGNKISKRNSNRFETILTVDNQNFYQRIWGRNSKDIFLLMTDGLVHYNGTDMEYLFRFSYPETKPWTQIYGAALFEKEVFFTVYEPPTHLKLIYHGMLNE